MSFVYILLCKAAFAVTWLPAVILLKQRRKKPQFCHLDRPSMANKKSSKILVMGTLYEDSFTTNILIKVWAFRLIAVFLSFWIVFHPNMCTTLYLTALSTWRRINDKPVDASDTQLWEALDCKPYNSEQDLVKCRMNFIFPLFIEV